MRKDKEQEKITRKELLKKIDQLPLSIKRKVRLKYKKWKGLLGMNTEELESFYGQCKKEEKQK